MAATETGPSSFMLLPSSKQLEKNNNTVKGECYSQHDTILVKGNHGQCCSIAMSKASNDMGILGLHVDSHGSLYVHSELCSMMNA